jgi:hypothetical protein
VALRENAGILLVGMIEPSNCTHTLKTLFQVACRERVHCASASGIGSRNSSFTRKSCACASITFLAGIISWSVDSTKAS